jgi:hypothetical protein
MARFTCLLLFLFIVEIAIATKLPQLLLWWLLREEGASEAWLALSDGCWGRFETLGCNVRLTGVLVDKE